MKVREIDTIKNKDFIVLLPESDHMIKDSVEYTFKNVFYLNYEKTEEDSEKLINFINNKDNELILFDYDEFYRTILPYIKKNKRTKWVFKDNISTLTNGWSRAYYNNVVEFYDRNIVDEILFLDKSTYEVFKNAGYRTKHILLDSNPNLEKTKKSKSIGLIGNDFDPNNNIYNELSALKLIDYDYIKLLKSMPATKHFISFFDIKEKEVNTIDEVIKDNDINLYCNFTFNNYELVLKSMDMEIPCLLGNTDIFDNYPNLKKYLVLESDDDIGEIADKIEAIRKHKKDILEEYKKFRKEYSKEVKELIKKI
ncbi:MAG: hypothetical protein IJI43_04085 [Bacilli bacterium]|nr:hypothetical protein [Bacilli bacterium]